MHFDELVPILELAIGPVILISGVGLLLLSMTNRFGRVIDRTRELNSEYRMASDERRQRLRPELSILARRARIVQLAIVFAVISVLMASALILSLFMPPLLGVELPLLSAALFIGCIISLIFALLIFLRDINLALKALDLDLE